MIYFPFYNHLFFHHDLIFESHNEIISRIRINRVHTSRISFVPPFISNLNSIQNTPLNCKTEGIHHRRKDFCRRKKIPLAEKHLGAERLLLAEEDPVGGKASASGEVSAGARICADGTASVEEGG